MPSAFATGGAITVIVTVAVELPPLLLSLYLNVSLPAKFNFGVKVKLPLAFSAIVPP